MSFRASAASRGISLWSLPFGNSHKDKDAVFVDAVCYRGEKKVFDFATGPEVAIVAAIEILRAGETPAAQLPILAQAGPGAVTAAWDGGGAAKLSVSTAGLVGD